MPKAPPEVWPPQPGTTFATYRIRPLMALAWLMLAYTWILGHWPESAHWLSLGWAISPWPTSAPFGLGNILKMPSAHSLCLFKQLIGLPCVFCGVTRSFTLLGQGQWAAALQYHLLSIPLYLITLFVAFFGWFAPAKVEASLILFRNKRLVVLLIALLVVCWLWKLGQNPVFW